MKTSLKDWPKVYRKIRGMRGMNVHEKILLAQCMAATPNERWELNKQRCEAFGVWGKGLAGKRKLERMRRAGTAI